MILALAILGVALATLGQAVGRSHRSARRVAEESQLAFVAQSVLDEVIAGLRPMAATDREPIADPGDATASSIALVTVQIDNGPLDGLLAIRVTAMPNDPLAGPGEAVELVRWIADPALSSGTTSTAEGSL